jgi:hypothetical protein
MLFHSVSSSLIGSLCLELATANFIIHFTDIGIEATIATNLT